jgi:predicted Zn-dependent peptidase
VWVKAGAAHEDDGLEGSANLLRAVLAKVCERSECNWIHLVVISLNLVVIFIYLFTNTVLLFHFVHSFCDVCPRLINETIEGDVRHLGGTLTSSTCREYTQYNVQCVQDSVPKVLQAIGNAFSRPLSESTVNAERGSLFL